MSNLDTIQPNFVPYTKIRVKTSERNRNKRYWEAQKDKVFAAYGNRCSCCGESHRAFLTVDHIGGTGVKYADRWKDPALAGGMTLYKWLEKNGYPKDKYRLLCHNCNWVERNGNVCPHNTTMRLAG